LEVVSEEALFVDFLESHDGMMEEWKGGEGN